MPEPYDPIFFIRKQRTPRPLDECDQLIEEVCNRAIERLTRQRESVAKSCFFSGYTHTLNNAIERLYKVCKSLETDSYLDNIAFMKPMLKAAQVVEAASPYYLGLSDTLREISSALYYHASIEIELDHLRIKAIDFDNQGYKKETKIVRDLLRLLENQNRLYFQDKAIDYLTFKTNCHSFIKEHKCSLQFHRGVIGILDGVLGVLLCFISLPLAVIPIPYTTIDMIGRYKKNGCFFFKTRTRQRLETLEECLTYKESCEK